MSDGQESREAQAARLKRVLAKVCFPPPQQRQLTQYVLSGPCRECGGMLVGYTNGVACTRCGTTIT